ncbi:hypothetical protein KAR91_27515 [Candidatus Pacearchaeota archaeon]|nr:hypothetical protein [Candidatus Pacearchaeota archaeon]
MNNIIAVAENKDKILEKLTCHCPKCNDELYSVFDRLYIAAFDLCIICTPDSELEENGNMIAQIL